LTGEEDRKRMLDAVTALNFPTRKGARYELEKYGHLNKGTQKALDEFYNQLVLKNGTRILRTSKGQIQARNTKGQIRSLKGLERFVKQFKEKTKK
jgi:hypothetical protein